MRQSKVMMMIKIVITCKCPAAFEWKMNQGWDAEERLQQRIHLEESKDPHLWDGPVGQKTQALKSDLEAAWNNKKKRKQAFWSCIENNAPTLSDREKLLFRLDVHSYHLGWDTNKQSQPRKCL